MIKTNYKNFNNSGDKRKVRFSSFKFKVTLVFIFIVLFFLILLFRSAQLQVFKNKALIGKAHKQIIRDSVIYPNRGQIFDKNGYSLAINVQRYSLFTIPKLISDKDKFISSLKKILPNLNNKTIENIVRRKNYTWIARKISLNKSQLSALKSLKKIYINKVPKRIYPNKNFASQLIGFVGMDNKGLSGIEFKFDDELHGNPRRIRYIKDAKGRLVKLLVDEKGRKGLSLNLTIDKEIQFIAEKYLKDGVLKFNADSGGIAVMDVKTGKIAAMANYPSFDPNKITNKEKKYWQSSFVVTPFEPGSIFKTLTIASALENKIVTPETGYYCEQGKYLVGDHLITEAESDHGQGWLSVSDILAYSSNIGTTKIGFDIKWDKLLKTLHKFKIGHKTGISLPGESRGILTNEKISPLKLSNISFGQGVATTGIQMLAAYAAIANNGIWNRPLIIDSEKVEGERIISKKTSLALIKLVYSVVEKGTGKVAQVKGVEVAGKTGTAQRIVNGKYFGYVSSFIGFPINVKNRFVILVYIVNPKKTYYGSLVAGPVFKKLLRYILYKNKEIKNNLSNFKIDQNKKLSKIKTTYRHLKFKHNIAPNFRGFDKKTIKLFAKKFGIKVLTIGSGISYKQSVSAGLKINKSSVIKIYFKVPSYE